MVRSDNGGVSNVSNAMEHEVKAMESRTANLAANARNTLPISSCSNSPLHRQHIVLATVHHHAMMVYNKTKS